MAAILTERGVDYEFDGPDLPLIVLAPVEEAAAAPVAETAAPVAEAVAPAPLPAPPVASTSSEPAPGSEGIPVEDPF